MNATAQPPAADALEAFVLDVPGDGAKVTISGIGDVTVQVHHPDGRTATHHLVLGEAPGTKAAAAQAGADLRWHYGPTLLDQNPDKMWCDCGGQVWVHEGTAVCGRCNATASLPFA